MLLLLLKHLKMIVLWCFYNLHIFVVIVGLDDSVGIATSCGLDGPGIESRRGHNFSHPYRPPWGPHSLPYNEYRVSFPGVKRSGRGVNHPPPSSAEVKERVELYLYSLSGPSWPVLGRTLPLPFCYA